MRIERAWKTAEKYFSGLLAVGHSEPPARFLEKREGCFSDGDCIQTGLTGLTGLRSGRDVGRCKLRLRFGFCVQVIPIVRTQSVYVFGQIVCNRYPHWI